MAKLLSWLKIATLSLLIVSHTPAMATALFSHVVIFGDSLSDVGNFPETGTFNTGQSIPDNLYVPISSPVDNTGQYTLYKPNGDILHHFNYPAPAKSPYLPKQQHLLNGGTRVYRSIIWPEYLLQLAYDDGYITSTPFVSPWVFTQTHSTANNNEASYSVDYAFSGALSNNTCNNSDQTKTVSCDEASIIESEKKYRSSPNTIAETSVEVPGIEKQIALYINDLKTQKVKVDNDTLYIIFVGGNDIKQAFTLIQHGSWKQKMAGIKQLTKGISNNVVDSISTLITNTGVSARHIFVLNLYDLKLSPEMVHYKPIIRPLATLFSVSYDSQLKTKLARLQKQYPNVSIHLFDTFKLLSRLSKMQQFSQSIGKRCDADNAYLQADAPTLNCWTDSTASSGYLFWNKAHPTSIPEQYIGYYLEKAIALGFNTPFNAKEDKSAYLY